ncbi:hypothetical protein MJO52_12995 [Microbulbifer variabilis]|uniref:Anti sigma-E protein RseA N-terminal domain-containing protein n=1 Tax=Microbulbifer variabilis TaxID=266805 RepID=A0ABY4V6U8_9GAMM|nr:hypothetical protein [Microbulbifer variabilis]USD19996.1 hypothetical protein MJO52_12995 [Microbulbifer variabilis]
MASQLEVFRELLSEIDESEELQRKFDQLSQLSSEGAVHDPVRARLELKKWKQELQGFYRSLRIMMKRMRSTSPQSEQEDRLRRLLIDQAEEKMEHIGNFFERIDTQIWLFEELIRSNQEKKQIEFTERALSESERANSIAQEGVHVASESSESAKMSADAARDSAEIARKGAVHTRRGVWVAAGSASIAALALFWQIVSQNKDVSVNLNSPVALQPVILSDESISNLTHAIAVELSKVKGEPVTLSPESIEELRAVLRLELERDTHIEVVETKENAKQKAN